VGADPAHVVRSQAHPGSRRPNGQPHPLKRRRKPRRPGPRSSARFSAAAVSARVRVCAMERQCPGFAVSTAHGGECGNFPPSTNAFQNAPSRRSIVSDV
jgi:hypothetical protein